MIVIPPITITPAILTATNATDAAAWAGGTTYALAAVVSRNYRNWVSLQAGNVGKTPENEPTWWYDSGPVNSMAMFDSSVSTATSTTGGLSFTLAPGARITGIGFMGLVGQGLTITITDGAGGPTVQTETITLARSDGTYYSWCLEDFVQTREAAFYGLLSTPNCRVVVSITGSGTTACGLCVVGKQFEIGLAEYGFGVPIEDRGRHYLDANDNPVNLERGYSKSAQGTIATSRANFNRLVAFFADYIAVPCLWVAAPDQNDLVAATLFGRFVRAVPVISDYSQITASLEIAGYR